MTPKEKALELVDKLYQTTPNEAWYNPPLGSSSMEYKAWDQAKECALIAVDEIIKVAYLESARKHWQEVKQELESM